MNTNIIDSTIILRSLFECFDQSYKISFDVEDDKEEPLNDKE
jgi:hypothetical protein